MLRSYWRNVIPSMAAVVLRPRRLLPAVIFTADAAQAQAAEASADAAARELGQPRSALKVELRQAARFWPPRAIPELRREQRRQIQLLPVQL